MPGLTGLSAAMCRGIKGFDVFVTAALARRGLGVGPTYGIPRVVELDLNRKPYTPCADMRGHGAAPLKLYESHRMRAHVVSVHHV